ncbi:MAG TPA: serine/threonine-protein kinase, partial [Gemmataceae bacterium]|nr:serine/threonine-protein kinase [Gemmataceae bacterium]
MSDNTNGSTGPDEHFENVLAEMLLAEEAGQPLDLSRVIRTYPELETPLRDYFRHRDGFGRLAPHLAPTTSQAAASPSSCDLTPGSKFGGYDILKELGRGGMGVVYLARQRQLDRLVALKLIRTDRLAHLTPREREEWLIRFRTEGQAAARIDDPHVATVHVVGELDGCPFYSMRYVEGGSLAEHIKEGRPLLNRRAALLMEQVARAVQACHDQGVLHRDLKPSNILVDARGRPCVTDFGLAKVRDAADSLTHTGAMLGSPHYVSPEQAQGAATVSEATDVYGLGATLYALLTGRPPFQGTTMAEVLYQVKYCEPAPPHRLNPAVDRDLNTITLRCLEKEPGRRFRSAVALADELERYLDGRPILSRPVGPVGRIARWCRRNPAFAALSAAAVVLITLAGTLFWAYSAASRAAGKAGEEVTQVVGKLSEAEERKQALAYLEDMPRAQRYLNAGEHTRARELLAKWRPREGQKDRRAWEWYFLDAQCREVGFSVRGHQGQVQAVAWSPRGDRLASA